MSPSDVKKMPELQRIVFPQPGVIDLPSRQINEFSQKGNRKKIELVSKPAEAGLAVYRHGALGVLADLQELLEDLVGGGRPVGEEQLLVVETVALETLGIVDFPATRA